MCQFLFQEPVDFVVDMEQSLDRVRRGREEVSDDSHDALSETVDFDGGAVL